MQSDCVYLLSIIQLFRLSIFVLQLLQTLFNFFHEFRVIRFFCQRYLIGFFSFGVPPVMIVHDTHPDISQDHMVLSVILVCRVGIVNRLFDGSSGSAGAVVDHQAFRRQIIRLGTGGIGTIKTLTNLVRPTDKSLISIISITL